MERLNLVFDTAYMESDLDEYEIRNLIVNNKRELGLISFDDYRTPLSYLIIIDGLTVEDEQYRLSISVRDRTLYREVEISAGGSGILDRFKAGIMNRKDLLYSMDASLQARNVLATMFREAEGR